MSSLAAALLFASEKTPAEEGRAIILAMLVVGLVFVSVIAVGELSRWLSRRRGGGLH